MFKTFLQLAACDYGIQLTDRQLDDLNVYYQLLIEWNEKINLTAITDPQEVAVKHMIDSLSCYEQQYFPSDCHVIDVGTGAGFPGLPLKIYRPDIHLTLFDSLKKRLTFLQQVVSDVVLSRAVARLNVLSELCLPFVKVGGYFIALKGAQYESERAEAEQAVAILGGKIVAVKPVKLPGLDDKRAIIYIRKEHHTPTTYPRKAGIPEKKPL